MQFVVFVVSKNYNESIYLVELTGNRTACKAFYSAILTIW